MGNLDRAMGHTGAAFMGQKTIGLLPDGGTGLLGLLLIGRVNVNLVPASKGFFHQARGVHQRGLPVIFRQYVKITRVMI